MYTGTSGWLEWKFFKPSGAASRQTKQIDFSSVSFSRSTATIAELLAASIGSSTTFERDLHAVRDKAQLGASFTRLCGQVAADLQRKGYVAKTIAIKLRYDDFKLPRAIKR